MRGTSTPGAMLKDGMSLETILKYTGLTAADLSDSVALFKPDRS